jgi:hypothetical protein
LRNKVKIGAAGVNRVRKKSKGGTSGVKTPDEKKHFMPEPFTAFRVN